MRWKQLDVEPIVAPIETWRTAMTLQAKKIVVLGGSSGIGLAVAQAAAREGANIVIVSGNAIRQEAARKTLPAGTTGHVANLGSEDAVRALFEKLGPFDHLVYTAGENLRLAPLASMDMDWARGFFGVRYWGALMAVRYAAPHINQGGSITLTSGSAGQRPQAGWGIAASICSAMEGLTRALAMELAPLRVNVVSPGVVKSPLWDAMPDGEREALYRHLTEALPLKHVGTPEEVAESYLYLMKQSYGTGQRITVDGGGTLV
jgi:NAD(P)-dependent dehydrogenase (short-subunit alcohol dehydrogenase family)